MIAQYLRKIGVIALPYTAVLMIANGHISNEFEQRTKQISQLEMEYKNAQQKLGLHKEQLIKEEAKKRVLNRYADWRANEELLQFVAGFSGGVIKLEREGDIVRFSREFLSDDVEEVHLTKAALRQLIYWQFKRFTIKGESPITRGDWTMSLRASNRS